MCCRGKTSAHRCLAAFLSLAFVAILSSAAAAAAPASDPPRALILYDSVPSYEWLGELHALQIANLLGHFPVEPTIAPVETYLAGEVEDYSVTFYIGDAFDNPLPDAFLSDVMATDRTVCWFKYNLWQIAWDEGGYWDPAFTSRYGFQFLTVDSSGFPEILYKGESLLKHPWDPDLGITQILDPDLAEVKALAYRPPAHPDGQASAPYAVHAGNLWYLADTPLTYVSEEDRYLAFCDLLHDIVGIDHPPSRRALIRIEDVDPVCDPADLVAVADYLYSEGVPFQVGVIPVFRDPLGIWSGEYPEEVRLSESPDVVEALHYMVARGGQIVLHGYTHQYDATANPYNGLTGDDCEFFLASWDPEGGHTELVGPVPEDSAAWVNDRIDQGLAELAACGLSPVAWETPHYVASSLDSVEFGRRFSLTTGRVLYFSAFGPQFAGQFYPYLIESDIYGQRILPENLGNVEPEAFYDYPPRFPADIVRAAEKNLVVRDAWASAYFHPYLRLRYLKQVVEGIKDLGYVYTSVPPLAAHAGPDKTILIGGSAALEGSASDGVPPYTYSWSPADGLSDPYEAQPIASPASTTTYTLTVTDDLGQTAADMVTVTVAPNPVAEAGPDKTIAIGDSATLEGSASAGVPPYTYSWSPTADLSDPEAAQPTASPSATTTYTLTVTDDVGQTDTDTVTVTVAPLVVADAGADTIIAAGGSTILGGSASGGLPPYSYSWSPADDLTDPYAPQPTASPSVTTTYTLTVTDDLGQIDTDTVTVTVATLVVAEAGPDAIIASGGSTILAGSASGGLPPYTYFWSPADNLSDPYAAQPTASPSATTTYTLTVTDDLGQVDTDTVAVTVAPLVVAEAGADTTIASGGSTILGGSASGGLPPYTYSWSPHDGLSDPYAPQPSASPSATTTYTLTVTDDLGQIDTDTVTVTVAPPVVAEAGADTTIASGGSSILGGSASGGLPPYSYSWSPHDGLSDPYAPQPTASPSATTTYTLTVTDDLAQVDTDTVTVTVAPPVVANAGPDRIIASGGSTILGGSASGGLPPYTYSWSPAAGLSSVSVAQPSASPSVTTTYTLTVTDDLGQIDTDTVTVTVAPLVVADAGPDHTIASGGSAVLGGSASGGSPPYTYSWSPAAGLSSVSVAQPSASPAATTTYTLTVTDDLGQIDTDTVTVTVAPLVVADAGADSTIASGGSAVLGGSASGGLPPYTYSWSPADGLSDSHAAQPTASPAVTTTYTLTVTDSLAQTDTDAITVTVASGVVADAGPDRTIAPGGSTILGGSASGGLPPYTYSWSPAADLSDPGIAQPTASPSAAATYTLTVTDDLGQTDTDTVTVTVAPPVVADAGPDGIIASGGSAILGGSASAGSPPYTYSWSPADGLSDPHAAQPTASPAVTITYTLTVTDSLAQTDTDAVTVTVASGVVADAGPDRIIASGGSTILGGSASGGSPPYTYSWSPAADLSDPGIAQPTASPAATTTYTLTVTDSLAQTHADTVTVKVVSFSDVPADFWAYGEIMACVTAGIVSGYPDGRYYPAGTVARDQMAVFIARAMAGGDANAFADPGGDPSFPDVPADYWAYPYIEYCHDHGVVQGYSDGYHPDWLVDRAQTAVYVARARGWLAPGDDMTSAPQLFLDVPAGFWAGTAIQACVANGVVRGYPDGNYHPDWVVTRDQMAVYVQRAFDLPL